MLDAFFNKSQSTEEKALDLLSRGLDMLYGRMFKQAMIQFQQAMKTNKPVVIKQLSVEFQKTVKENDYEAGLAIGLILIKDRPKDFELANTLGNCARHQKNYKQANSLYKHALKINRKYKLAFFNLAASMARVEKFDQEVAKSIEQFASMDYYILPDYCIDPKLIDKLEARLTSNKRSALAEETLELSSQASAAAAENDMVAERELKLQIELKKEEAKKPITPEEVYTSLKQRIKAADEQNEPSLSRMAAERMNLVIFSLLNKDGNTALSMIKEMDQKGLEIEYLEMCKAISFELTDNPEDAIDMFTRLLGEDTSNRYLNLNMGILYRRQGSSLLATKYLSIGASLLEKSDGLYRLSELIEIADQSYDNGQTKKALNLYRIVCNEVDSVAPHMKLGEIYLAEDMLEESTASFRIVLSKEPDNQLAKDRLRELHDAYFEKAEAFFRDNKYKAAAGVFERALSVMRLPETVRKTASVYQVLRKPLKSEALMSEYEAIKAADKELQEEKERQSNILLGKAYLKAKRWSKAIEHFENAFRMKVDKDVFVYLATVYRQLKKTEEMKDLLNRWNRMVDREEKLQRFQ